MCIFIQKVYVSLSRFYIFIHFMNAKKQRQSMIEDIVRSEVIRNQDDLQKSLLDKGFEVTQATLSRDIREMKIVKSHDSESRFVYTLPKTHLPVQAHDKPIVEFSGNLAVIKTRPGYAMGIASDIDNHAPEEILGTIAGDDTILVIPRDGYTKVQISRALEQFITD